MERSVKPFKTYEEQIQLLVSRGMAVNDHDLALRTLRTINYYRISDAGIPIASLARRDV